MSLKPTKDFLDNATFLVDSSSYIFRAYYAIRTNLRAPDGTPTHATFGFIQMVLSLLEEHGQKRILMVWDHKDPGFRDEIFSDYKANRSAPPEDLGLQIENAKKGMDLLGIPQVEKGGFEADDIIATVIAKNPTRNFVVVTSDKDLLQLVGPHVWCLDTGKNLWSNRDQAKEKFGVEPHQIKHVQALSGDAVDNIKGAPGIGPKTATELIQHYGTLEALLKEATELAHVKAMPAKEHPLKGKRLSAIADNIPQIEMSLKLVTLHPDAPVETNMDIFQLTPMKREEWNLWANTLGFQKLSERLKTFGLPETTKTTEAQKIDWTCTLIKNLEQLKKVFESKASARSLCLDTETHSLDLHKSHNMVGFSFSFDGQEGFYVPCRHKSGDNVEAASALQLLFEYLKTRTMDFQLIFQNAKFDLHVFAGEGFFMPPDLRIDDTMIASFVIDPAEAHGMDDLSQKYLGGYTPVSFETVLGELNDFSEINIADAGFYAAEDAVVTYRLWDILSEKLKSENLWDVYDILDRPLMPLLFEMERNGVSIDPNELKELSGALKKELSEREEKARHILRASGLEVDPEMNLGSPKQMAQILYEKLQLPVLKKGKTGPSTDASVLSELAAMHPFPAEILEIRELAKLLSTYVDALPLLVNPQTGRLHTDFSQTVAVTGRLSSSNPNLQNIPIRTERGKKIRAAFRASPGHVLVGIDYSQIELRVLAYVSQDKELVRAFNENADIHRRTASLILGKAESEITSEDRRMAKTINFGIIYGQSAFGLSKTLKIGRAEAQRFIDDYFRTYPDIKAYMDKSVITARETGFATTLTGRRRAIPDIQSRNQGLRQFAERTAVNSPIQGTAADLMKAAMISAAIAVKKALPLARLVLQVHDELIFEVLEADAESLRQIAVKSLEDGSLLRRFKIENFSLVTRVEANIGRDWGEL